MANATSASEIELERALRDRLISSGEYDRLLIILKERLESAGWNDSVRAVARERARDNKNLTTLVSEVEPSALDMIPSNIKQEIEKMMQEFVKKNVE